MKPTNEWLKKYEEAKEKSISPVDFNDYFELPEICGMKLSVINIGECSLPSGEVVVCDPLVYLGYQETKPYFMQAPKGKFETEICVIESEDSNDCDRYAAVRVRFNDKRAVKFYEALVGDEEVETLQGAGEDFFGFGVDAGLGCICDELAREAYCEWEQKWYEKNAGMNIFDDYFDDVFKESYKNSPKFQRSGGDWINWTIPDTEYHIPMFQSGFGDGVYPVYWGVDEAGEICQVVINFIDIELEFGEDDEE